VTSSYRAPTIGGAPANAPSVGRPNQQGASSAPNISVSNSGNLYDNRSADTAYNNEINRNAGFTSFMDNLLEIGGKVSNKFQYNVEKRGAGELISSPEAMDIIKQGKGPANGLLFSFRDEIRDQVVNTAATEVARDAAEKFSANYYADAELKDQDWLLNATPEALVKKFESLQDPETSQQLRNLTVMSPAGTADVVSSYQGLISRARTDTRTRKIEMRLENNAVIVRKTLDSDVTALLDAKEPLIQAEKDGFGGEVEPWTDKAVDAIAPKLRAKAETLGVPVSMVLQRNVQDTLSRIDALAVTAAEQTQQNLDPTETMELMHKEWQRANFYRALADSPALKRNADDVSVFTLRDPKSGKTLDEDLNEYRKKYFTQVEQLQIQYGQRMADQALVEVALDPVQSPESVNAVVSPMLERLRAIGDYKSMAAIIKGSRESMGWKMTMDDRQRDAVARQAVYDLKALIAEGREPTEADRDKIIALGEAGVPALDVYISDKEKREQKQDVAIRQQEEQVSAAVKNESDKWFPDASRLAGAAVDVKGMIAAGKENGTISQTAVVLDDQGLQQALAQRMRGILQVKMQEELVRTGATEVSPARAEVIVKEALDEAVRYAVSSLPSPPKIPPGAKQPERGDIFRIEEEAYEQQIRGNGGRPTILAIPKRIREQVLRQNPRATFTDMMAAWNKESAGIDVKGPDGKPFFTKDIGLQRQQRLREIQGEKKENGTFNPLIQVPDVILPPAIKSGLGGAAGMVKKAVLDGWSMFGLTPQEVTPPDAPLNSAMPQSETVTVTAPAPGKAAAKPAVPDTSGIPPAAVPKVEAGLLRIAGVDPAKTGGVAKPLLNNDTASLAFAGQLAAGTATVKADSPPLPQAAPELEAVRISPNARSKDSPWVYAVLATSYKAQARGRDGNITLPDWMFERKPGSLGLEGRESSGGDFIPNSSGQYIATGTVRGLRGMSADGMTQTLHGIKGREGYDAAHGAGNDHVHHQGPDAATTLELAKFLQKRGFPITEFKSLNQRVGGHSEHGGHYDGTAFDIPVGVERHGETLKAINEFYIMKGRRGEGIQREGKGHLAMNENNPFVQAIGYAEGNLDRNGRPTGSYAGHTDPGNGARNVGIFSAQGVGGDPAAANRVWFDRLNKVAPVFDNALQKRGAKPGTPVYDRIMANLLDLYVQAPAAVKGAGGLLSRVKQMIDAGGDLNAIAQARVDSFIDPRTGALDAPGFGNDRNRLLKDQRRRAASLKEKFS
jgi:hypothetical protein